MMSWSSLKPFCIGGESDPYLKRWLILPRNKWFCIYLHQMLRDDDDRAMHDHPADNISIVLKGGYDELMFGLKPISEQKLPWTIWRRRLPGKIIYRKAEAAHRLSLVDDRKPSWSIFIMFRKRREWGFWCPQGRWVHWRDFTAGDNGEIIGKGCDP